MLRGPQPRAVDRLCTNAAAGCLLGVIGALGALGARSRVSNGRPEERDTGDLHGELHNLFLVSRTRQLAVPKLRFLFLEWFLLLVSVITIKVFRSPTLHLSLSVPIQCVMRSIPWSQTMYVNEDVALFIAVRWGLLPAITHVQATSQFGPDAPVMIGFASTHSCMVDNLKLQNVFTRTTAGKDQAGMCFFSRVLAAFRRNKHVLPGQFLSKVDNPRDSWSGPLEINMLPLRVCPLLRRFKWGHTRLGTFAPTCFWK